MTSVRDKVHHTLSENRTLVLGATLLLGFQFQAVFRPGFERLGEEGKALELTALGLMLLSLACLVAPTAFHRIVEGGNHTVRVLRYARWTIGIGLAAFALGLGANVWLGALSTYSGFEAAILGASTATVALVFWFLWAMLRRRSFHDEDESEGDDETPLRVRIDDLLIEGRIVLPGVQALFGFQLAAFLTDAFERLPEELKLVHLVSLLLMVLAIIMLMTPPPHHRIAHGGDDSERFDRFATWVILASLVPLGLGLGAELYVVVTHVLGDREIGAAASITLVSLCAVLWFGVPVTTRLWNRSKRRPS